MFLNGQSLERGSQGIENHRRVRTVSVGEDYRSERTHPQAISRLALLRAGYDAA